jgi:hypothetical protein
MLSLVLTLGFKYGVPAIGALFSYLAHRKGRQNHALLLQAKGGPPKQ